MFQHLILYVHILSENVHRWHLRDGTKVCERSYVDLLRNMFFRPIGQCNVMYQRLNLPTLSRISPAVIIYLSVIKRPSLKSRIVPSILPASRVIWPISHGYFNY